MGKSRKGGVIHPSDYVYVADYLRKGGCRYEAKRYGDCVRTMYDETSTSELKFCRDEFMEYMHCIQNQVDIKRQRFSMLVQMQKIAAQKSRARIR